MFELRHCGENMKDQLAGGALGRMAILHGAEVNAPLIEVGEHLGGEGEAAANAVELPADEGVAGLEYTGRSTSAESTWLSTGRSSCLPPMPSPKMAEVGISLRTASS